MSADLPFKTPPARVCILRLSAIGDTCHVVPLLHRLQKAWPSTRFTWVIGKLEARLMGLFPGVEFITVDKRAGREAREALHARLAECHFDLLLHLQVALRASLLARRIPARIKLGFDFGRARELQWLFTNRRIARRRNEHVLDSFQGFADALGLPATPLDHALPLPADALDYAKALIPDGAATLVVSPCSSHALRNWRADRYAAVIDHAWGEYGLRTILCGGPSPLEREICAAIESTVAAPIINQAGKDTLPQMLALLGRATVLLSPDSGPAHMGTLAGVPVIGLYAATNPARSGPYLSRAWSVDRYDDAAQRFCGKPATALAWTRKIEVPGVMDLVTVEDVQDRLRALAAAGLLRSRA